ncbi:LuxR C-terminal-related transcriptional regulator [Streptomyces sp. WM6378]|uniref:LuxR C-terminal-related transcriptional regulator n=1 Tax=Streptomyces sp. WM6378 TaxID=1415557 RepID=UPI0006B01EC6|nr:LuxR C-terminal-related transcriptional regulator [Streptomyces sp. WM6378]KOU43916.1 LuxR family transcriptional regulator [Streptomyces sp. WM6378]
MSEQVAHPHGADRLCAAGERAYAQALRAGRLAREAAGDATCLIDLGLLHPDPGALEWLLPTSPQAVMARLLRGIHEDIAASQARTGVVAAAFERFAALDAPAPAGTEAIRVLDGIPRINAAIDDAIAGCTTEALTIQPRGIRPEHVLSQALPRALDMVERGVRMRTLYTHVARYGTGLADYLHQLEGRAVEVRTLDEVTDRLLLFDRTVAIIPAAADDSSALELRHPALVEYLATVFERLWRLAVPLTEAVPAATDIEGVTHRERVIAALLAEGHQDAVIAQRLGISVRTCRHHISRLADVLGSSSRTQLGVRIAQLGLDAHPR